MLLPRRMLAAVGMTPLLLSMKSHARPRDRWRRARPNDRVSRPRALA
jgi:hypothetical protein